MTKTILAFAGVAASLLVISACQSDKRPANPGGSGKSASLRVMEQVAIAAHKCWIASKDPAFAKYSMANELNNFGGTPRFLLVPKNNYGGKPLLVVQARGHSSEVEDTLVFVRLQPMRLDEFGRDGDVGLGGHGRQSAPNGGEGAPPHTALQRKMQPL